MGRCRGDMGRYRGDGKRRVAQEVDLGDTGEMYGRYTGDKGEIWGDIGEVASVASRRKLTWLGLMLELGLGLGLGFRGSARARVRAAFSGRPG